MAKFSDLFKRSVEALQEEFDQNVQRQVTLAQILGKQFQRKLDEAFSSWDPRELDLNNFSHMAEGGFVVIQDMPYPMADVATGTRFEPPGTKAAAYELEVTTSKERLTGDTDIEKLFARQTEELHAYVKGYQAKSTAFFTVSKPIGYLLEDGPCHQVLAKCSVFGLRRA